MTELIEKITAVLNTLDSIEIKGAKNLDAMLGCMQTLHEVRRQLLKQEEGENNG